MSKNKKQQIKKIFGQCETQANSERRKKQMSHIQNCIQKLYGIKNRITKGKLNQSGKFIKKPDWTTGFLEYEPNPDAAIHEVGHLVLAPNNMPLGDIQNEMDKQFGFVNSYYGYMKQKRSFFEVLPMAMEQKIRRRFGLPAYDKLVETETEKRTSIETGEVIAVNFKKDNRNFQLIRSARNLDKKCLERLEMIDNGELVFDNEKGWVYSDSIDAKINRRARLKKVG